MEITDRLTKYARKLLVSPCISEKALKGLRRAAK